MDKSSVWMMTQLAFSVDVPFGGGSDFSVTTDGNMEGSCIMSDEERRIEFNSKACDLLQKAQKQISDGIDDNTLIGLLQEVMIYADENTIEWHKSKKMYDQIRQRRGTLRSGKNERLIFYLKQCEHDWGAWGEFNTPSEETISLLEALYLKKKSFMKYADQIISFEEITIEGGNQYDSNPATLRIGKKSYYCDEFTYFNSLSAKYHRMNRKDRQLFERKNRHLTIQEYCSHSWFLQSEQSNRGESDGFFGGILNRYGCLIKLIEDLPNNTLIERKKSYRDEYGRIEREDGPFEDLFTDNEPYIVSLAMDFLWKYKELEKYREIYKLTEIIQKLCVDKNIYFDYNPYGDIVKSVQLEESKIEYTTIRGVSQRYNIIKYKDTYIDGHVNYHEEVKPVNILEQHLEDKKTFFKSLKSDRVIETYDVVYEDNVKGSMIKEYYVWTDN